MSYLAGHALGDWILQNDWMAKNKPKVGLAFWAHIAVASLSMCVVTGWWDERGLLAMASHALIDGLQLPRRWMGLYRQSDFEWLRIVIDQMMHLLSLYFISQLAV